MAEMERLLARIHSATGRDSSAQFHYERAIAVLERVAPGSEAEVDCRAGRGRALIWRGEYLEGKHEIERAMAMESRERSPEGSRYARMLGYWAVVLDDLGSRDSSRAAYERALTTAERVAHPDSTLLSALCNNFGRALMWSFGDIREARRAYERAVAIDERRFGPLHEGLAHPLINLGELETNLGNYARAESLIHRAQYIWEIHNDMEGISWALTSLGIIGTATGRFREAEANLKRGLEIREGLSDADILVAYSVLNLAKLYLVLRDDQAALPLLERAVSIRERLQPGSPLYAYTLYELGQLCGRTGNPERGLHLLDHAVRIYEKIEGSDPPSAFSPLIEKSGILRRLGRPQEALSVLDQVERIQAPAGYPDRRVSRAVVMTNRADLMREMLRFDDAIEIYNSSLALLDSIVGSSAPWCGWVLWNRALTYQARREVQSAMQDALRSSQLIRSDLTSSIRYLSEDRALTVSTRRTRSLDLALSLAVDRGSRTVPALLFDEVVRSRGLVFDGIAARRRTEQGIPDSLRSAYAEAAKEVAEVLIEGLDRRQGPDYVRRLNMARDRMRDVEMVVAEIGKTPRSGASLDHADSALGLGPIARAIPEGGILLSYVAYMRHVAPTLPGMDAYLDRHHYAAFVLAAGSTTPVLVPLGRQDVIDSLVVAWRGAILAEAARPGSVVAKRYGAVSRALRRAVWDPVAAHLAEADRVFIVPDGQLQLVHFAALPSTGSAYLIEDGPLVHYLSTERDLITAKVRSRDHALLAMGNPDFDSPDGLTDWTSPDGAAAPKRSSEAFRGPLAACEFLDQSSWETLVHTRHEVETVSRIWRTSQDSLVTPALMLTGKRATESAFKQLASGSSVLHLATHGFFIERRCRGPSARTRGIGGLSYQNREPGAVPAEEANENPLRLSGLVLAGANRRGAVDRTREDGILTSEEIAALDLSRVRLAVLSACDTGIGPVVPGEGVFGLRRSFQAAGAGSVVMSLFPVEDRSARLWVERFYRAALQDRIGIAPAVRQASLDLLQQRRAQGKSTHPFYWASFVATGDWR